jgi:hypothetical protein
MAVKGNMAGIYVLQPVIITLLLILFSMKGENIFYHKSFACCAVPDARFACKTSLKMAACAYSENIYLEEI